LASFNVEIRPVRSALLKLLAGVAAAGVAAAGVAAVDVAAAGVAAVDVAAAGVAAAEPAPLPVPQPVMGKKDAIRIIAGVMIRRFMSCPLVRSPGPLPGTGSAFRHRPAVS
jgi:hypothetical protein